MGTKKWLKINCDVKSKVSVSITEMETSLTTLPKYIARNLKSLGRKKCLRNIHWNQKIKKLQSA